MSKPETVLRGWMVRRRGQLLPTTFDEEESVVHLTVSDIWGRDTTTNKVVRVEIRVIPEGER